MFLGAALDLFVGFAVGYMYVYGALKFFAVLPERAKAWESRFPFKNFAREPHFALTDGSASNDGLPTFVRSTAPPTTTSTFSAFQGKGVRLGRGESSPANVSTSSSQSRTSVEPGATSLAGKSALVSKDGKFQKPTPDINDEDLITIDEPDVRKKANDYSLVNQDTSSESV